MQGMELADCLRAALSEDPGVRIAGEQCLSQLEGQQGYGVGLGKMTVDGRQPLELRHLGAVLLKQYVKKHWQEGDKNYVAPTTSPEDKSALRNLLPQALGDEHAKIRTAVSMAVATMARSDWPEEWPGLMEFLLAGLRDHSNAHRVHGTLRCLELFADDIDHTHMPALVPLLFPDLHTIVDARQVYGSKMRRRALSILHNCIATLGHMSGAYQKETRDLVAPLLRPWMAKFAHLLDSPVPVENPEDWATRVEVLKTLVQVIEYFPELAAAHMPVVLGPLWQTFTSGVSVYERAAIDGEDEAFNNLVDSDGDEQSLEVLMIQLFETLTTIIGNPRYKRFIQGGVEELVYTSLAYMRITEDQVELWTNDSNRYLADEEDDTYSCRVSGEILLEELVEVLEERGLKAITRAVHRRLMDAEKARSSGVANWWKWREAAFLTLGTMSPFLIKSWPSGSRLFDVDAFVDNMLQQDLQPDGSVSPFLCGRALWTVSRFTDAMSTQRAVSCLQMAVSGLASDRPLTIKLGACHAISKLVPIVDVEVLRPLLSTIYAGLGSLFGNATEETLHLVLVTLTAAVEADSVTIASMEHSVSPAVLQVWSEYASDPLIHVDAVELLKAIAKVPQCIGPLMSRAVPALATILQNPPQPSAVCLVDAALDLLSLLMESAPIELVRAAHDATFASVIKIAMESNDSSELQSAEECLAMFVRKGANSLLEWGGNPEQTLQLLLQCALRLLDPSLEQRAAFNVGIFVTQLICRLQNLMAPHLPRLVSAMLSRMENAHDTFIPTSLLLVFARLVHMSAPNVGQLLDLVSSIPGSGAHSNALAFLMSTWTRYQGDIRGAYQIKVSTTALALILSSRDPRLHSITVPGHLVQENKGIMTRSKAKTNPDKWTEMALPAKLLALLADALIELQEGDGGAADEEEEDWEEAGSQDFEVAEGECVGLPGLISPVESLSRSGSSSAKSVFRPAELMPYLLTDDDEFDDGDDGYSEDPDAAEDPINSIDLSVYLVDFIRQFADTEQQMFMALCQELTERQKSAMQTMVLQR